MSVAEPILVRDEPSDAHPSTANASRAGVVARRAVYGATVGYAVLFSTAVTLYYYSFQEQRLDMGDMVQAIWSGAHGHLLDFTTPTGAQMSRLGAHVDIFLALLVPLWWLVASPLALLVIQVFAVASGALPTYWLGRKHLGSDRAGAHLAVGYLLFPVTQFNAFTPLAGFHPVSFALPLLMYAIWFLDEKRLVPFSLVAVVAASTKEEIAAAIGCLGIWYAVRRGERAAGSTIAAIGFGVSAIEFLVILPHFSIAGFAPFAQRYSSVGGSVTGILHKAVADPGGLLRAVGTPHKLGYLALLFVPFLGLFLAEPLLALAAVPDLAINLLSSFPNQTTLEYQYNAGIVPFLLAASIIGMRKIRRDPERLAFYAFGGLAVLSVFSPLFALGGAAQAFGAQNAVREAKTHAVHMIPSRVPVAASNHLAGYLSARKYVYVFPYIRNARWVVIDQNDTSTVADRASYLRAIKQMDSYPAWDLVYASHGVQVLKKETLPGEGAP